MEGDRAFVALFKRIFFGRDNICLLGQCALMRGGFPSHASLNDGWPSLGVGPGHW